MTIIGNPSLPFLIVLVSVLGLIQIPMDIRLGLLSRRATLGILVAVLAVTSVDTLIQSDPSGHLANSILATGVVTVVYLVTHRASPKLLGFGDVLLVAPLSLSVAYSGWEAVLPWQFVAASTAAVHGILARVRHGRQTVAYGPHLIVTALVFILFMNL